MATEAEYTSLDQIVAIQCDAGAVVNEVWAGINIAMEGQPVANEPSLAGTGRWTGSRAGTKRSS